MKETTLARLKARYRKGLFMSEARRALGLTNSYKDTQLFHGMYQLGAIPAAFPVPATIENANTATSYQQGYLLELLVTRIGCELGF